MATATTETRTVTKTEEVKEKVYTVTLSQDEAATLFALTGRVIGDFAPTTYSQHTTAFRVALIEAGLPYAFFDSRFIVSGTKVRGLPVTK